MALTYTEQMQRIVRTYRERGNAWPASTKELGAWAIGEGLWRPNPTAVLEMCANDLARAMREEHIVDPQGRSVRAKHAARVDHDGSQMMLWDDIRTAPREFLHVAFQQRRQQIVGDCKQLKSDIDSFNENRAEQPIQIEFDFTADLAELAALEG